MTIRQSPKKNCAYLYFHRYLAPRYLKTKHVAGKGDLIYLFWKSTMQGSDASPNIYYHNATALYECVISGSMICFRLILFHVILFEVSRTAVKTARLIILFSRWFLYELYCYWKLIIISSIIFINILREYGKNGFVEVSKNLDTDLKIILLDHQNNYIERLSWWWCCKKF